MKNNNKLNDKDNITNQTVLSKFEKYMYIKVVIAYLIATIFMFAFGPIKYEVRHPLLLYTYVLFSFFIMYLGFVVDVNKKKNSLTRKRNIIKSPIKVFKITTIIYLALIPLTLYARTGSYIFDFSQFSDLGGAYLERYYHIQSRGRSYGEWLRIIFSPLTVAYIPLGYVYWDQISKKYRFLFIFGILLSILVDILSGTNKAFADLIIVSLILFTIRSIKSVRIKYPKYEQYKIMRKYVKKVKRNIFIALIVFAIFFSKVMESRLGGINLNRPNTNYEHPIVKIIPNDALKQAAVSITSYLTQGYHALDISFDKPFQSTFGLGSSMYILDSTEKWFGTDYFIKRSYIYKNHVQDGWDAKIRWSSFYVWVANDFSFYGVLIIIYFIGKILGSSWRRIISTYEVESLVILCIFTQLCFYIPANNQVMQLAESLVGNIFWLVLWILNTGFGNFERR